MEVLKPVKERFKMVIFVSKIFTFMMKILQTKNRNLKTRISVLEETVYEQNMIIQGYQEESDD